MPAPKLLDYQVREIRTLYAAYLAERSPTPHDTSKHRTTLVDIGKLYDVSWDTVWRVGERISYIHVPDKPAHSNEGRMPEQITPRSLAKREERARKYKPPKGRGRDKRGRFTSLD